MDRLFGKEISNILEGGYLGKHRNLGRVSSKVRGVSVEQAKKEAVRNSLSITTKPLPSSEPLSDLQCVPEYFEECLQFMQKQENRVPISEHYMESQREVTLNMRGILIDWLLDLHLKFKMFPETLFTIVTFVDRYLSKKQISKGRLQLVGIAALFLAAKYEETYQVPELRDLVHLSAKAFSKEEILEMEADIIHELDFELIIDSTYKFFCPFAKLSKLEPKNFCLAQYVLEMSLLQLKFSKYNPSLLAASAIYLINKIRKRSPSWSDLMVAATGYEQQELKTCARELCYLLENADTLANNKSLKRKFSMPSFYEVTKIRLERREKPRH